MTTPTHASPATPDGASAFADLSTQDLLIRYRRMRFGRGSAFATSLKVANAYLDEGERRDAALARLRAEVEQLKQQVAEQEARHAELLYTFEGQLLASMDLSRREGTMATEYCLITYPGGEPTLAELDRRGPTLKIGGHGLVVDRLKQGCTVVPLVAVSAPRLAAIRYAAELLDYAAGHLAALEEMLRELLAELEVSDAN